MLLIKIMFLVDLNMLQEFSFCKFKPKLNKTLKVTFFLFFEIKVICSTDLVKLFV